MLEIKNTVKTSIKRELNVKDLIKDAKDNSKELNNKATGSAVHENTSKSEFRLRYKNITILMYGLLLILIVTLSIIPFYLNLFSVVICILASLIFSMFYFRYAFTAWRARLVFENWDNRFDDFTVTTRDFYDDISINIKNIFPLPLKGSKNDK